MLSAYQTPVGSTVLSSTIRCTRLREQGRVHLADVGAVGVAEVAQLRLAERRPDRSMSLAMFAVVMYGSSQPYRFSQSAA